MSSDTRSRNRLNKRVNVMAVKRSQRKLRDGENGDNIESSSKGERVSSKSRPDMNREVRPFSSSRPVKRIYPDSDSRPNGVVRVKDNSRTKWGLSNSEEKQLSERKFDLRKSTPDNNRMERPFSSNQQGKRISPDLDSRSNGVRRAKDSSRTKWGLSNSKEKQLSQRKFDSSKSMPDNNRKDRTFSSDLQGKRISLDLDSWPNGAVRSKDSSRTMWGLANSKEKRYRESKFDLSKSPSPGVSSLQGLSKRMDQEKKKRKRRFSEDRGEVLDEKPIKTKRVIRIDRYDVSNKRLDDGIGAYNVPDNKKEKIGNTEEKLEMSKNAQFRAIQPSSSILSYVEDNLLGRRCLIELQRAGYNIDLSAPLDNVPNSTSSERERVEENVFRNKLEFFAAAKVYSSFPPPEFPEIAFAGRSNVGKSSLLNSLTRQWGVVRTSDKPGLTQTINFFDLGSKLTLVDLPGYGFAYAKEEVKDAWEELICELVYLGFISGESNQVTYTLTRFNVKEYVSTRAGLKRVCLLIDTKWGMKPRDHELIDLMERAQTKYQIVLTKTDVVFPIDVARRAMQIEESLKTHKSIVQPVMMVSSKSGAGIRSLRTVLAKIGRFAKL